MLRAFVLALGGILLLGGVWLVAARPVVGPGWALIVLGVMVLLGTLLERVHYKPIEHAAPGPGWTDTGERFRDPESGDLLAVWAHGQEGERRYVKIGSGKAA